METETRVQINVEQRLIEAIKRIKTQHLILQQYLIDFAWKELNTKNFFPYIENIKIQSERIKEITTKIETERRKIQELADILFDSKLYLDYDSVVNLIYSPGEECIIFKSFEENGKGRILRVADY